MASLFGLFQPLKQTVTLLTFGYPSSLHRLQELPIRPAGQTTSGVSANIGAVVEKEGMKEGKK